MKAKQKQMSRIEGRHRLYSIPLSEVTDLVKKTKCGLPLSHLKHPLMKLLAEAGFDISRPLHICYDNSDGYVYKFTQLVEDDGKRAKK